MNRLQKMTKLQKDSIVQFIITTVAALIGIVMFTIMRSLNTKGFEYVIICVVVGIIGGLATAIFGKYYNRHFDERQLLLSLKASRISAFIFMAYIIALSIFAFFIIGGKGELDVYCLPLAAFIGLFMSQAIETSVIFFGESVE